MNGPFKVSAFDLSAVLAVAIKLKTSPCRVFLQAKVCFLSFSFLQFNVSFTFIAESVHFSTH